MGQTAKRAGGDEVRRVLDDRRPAVVVADERDSPVGRAGERGGLQRLLRGAADRLLAEHVLAALEGRPDHVEVRVVRGRDADGLDRRVVDDIVPVRGRSLEAEPGLRGRGTSAVRVGAGDEPGGDPALREPVADEAVRAAVGLAHPAHPDHADAHDPTHRVMPPCGAPRSLSVPATAADGGAASAPY